MTSRSKKIAIPAMVAGALGLGAGAIARAAEPTADQLMQQIQELQAKVQQLETKQQTQSAVSAQQVDATVERVLQDAEKRSQLLQMEGFTAGYSKGRFTIQDAAGNWVLRPSLEFQFRGVANIRNEPGEGGISDILDESSDKQKGFEVSRMAFGFDGVACTPNLTYLFQWNTDTDGSVGLERAFVRYAFNDTMAIQAGQFRNPVFHEQDIGRTTQLAVDRSLANALITGVNEALTQAVEFQFEPMNTLSIRIGAEDGFASGNSDFTDPSSGGVYDWGMYGRVNFFVMGTKGAYSDFSAVGDHGPLLVFGGGLDVTQTGSTNDYLHTIDAQWETGGLGLYAAYLGDYRDSGGDDNYNWGFLIQAGYMVTPSWEVFGRWDYSKFDDNAGASEFCELTIGVNWYMCAEHNVKLTIDGTWLPNGSPTELRSLGILASEDQEWILRGQFQLLL